MLCSRCGAEAAIRRDAAYYCGKCAVARDWGEIIAFVQEGAEREQVVFEDAAAMGDPFRRADAEVD